ncbi:MAG: enoyl-CoA hydratase, partial [candidate division Zixibacteria bacterium]|nr:enoyl-CoA hydratase [candidate division Zixibacteria bacterium]
MEEYITLTRSDGVATVTIDRPEKRNAVDYRGWLEIRRIVVNLAA